TYPLHGTCGTLTVWPCPVRILRSHRGAQAYCVPRLHGGCDHQPSRRLTPWSSRCSHRTPLVLPDVHWFVESISEFLLIDYQLEVLFQLRHDLGLGAQTHEFVHLLTTLEDQHRGDGHDLEHCAQGALRIDINAGHDNLVTVFPGDFLDYRAQLLAWPTPLRPEIDEDRLVGLDDGGFEGLFGYCDYIAHGCSL